MMGRVVVIQRERRDPAQGRRGGRDGVCGTGLPAAIRTSGMRVRHASTSWAPSSTQTNTSAGAPVRRQPWTVRGWQWSNGARDAADRPSVARAARKRAEESITCLPVGRQHYTTEIVR